MEDGIDRYTISADMSTSVSWDSPGAGLRRLILSAAKVHWSWPGFQSPAESGVMSPHFDQQGPGTGSSRVSWLRQKETPYSQLRSQ